MIRITTPRASPDQATSGEFLDWICDECFSTSCCSFNSSTSNTTLESDLTSESTSEDHDVISNQQDSNNFSYLKLHLSNKGLRFGQWNVNHLTSSKFEQIKLLLTKNSDCIDILFLTETFLKPSNCDSLYNIQSLSNVLGQITILTTILKNVYPPRPLFNVGTRLLQIMVAVHIQISTPTLNWGGGERRANF